MSKLAIHGGIPVFGNEQLTDLIPKWPPRFPETREKLLEIYDSGKWGMCGQYEKKLMDEFAKAQTAEHCVWMANGTVTLECALLALGVGPGDEVIVPGVSWIATAECANYVGAKPVIVDIDPETCCIDPLKIEEAITPRTRAIIPVHVFSAVADMDAILAIARKHGLFVVEDCAHAHGAAQHGRGVGSIGDVGSFSFQLSKLMTAGEGGCCTTNSGELMDRIFRASHIGTSCVKPGSVPPEGYICHQYRFTEFQAAIIYDQLQHQKEMSEKRKKSWDLLMDLLKDTPGILPQRSSCEDDCRAFYFPTFLLQYELLKPGVDRAAVFAALKAEGAFFHEGWGFPLYQMGVWNVAEKDCIKHETPVCEDVMLKRVMCPYSQTALLAEESVVRKIAESLDKVMRYYIA